MDELIGYIADTATGFLEKNEKNTFSAYEKTKFLKALKLHGNQSKAARDLGYSFDIIELHLRKDLIFNKAFKQTLLEMRHDLESTLYTAGLDGDGRKAKIWLDVHFPEAYKPGARTVPKKERDTSVIDDLYDKAVGSKQ